MSFISGVWAGRLYLDIAQLRLRGSKMWAVDWVVHLPSGLLNQIEDASKTVERLVGSMLRNNDSYQPFAVPLYKCLDKMIKLAYVFRHNSMYLHDHQISATQVI